MIEDTIGKIEARIESAESIKEERRVELLELLGTLKSEVARLSGRIANTVTPRSVPAAKLINAQSGL